MLPTASANTTKQILIQNWFTDTLLESPEIGTAAMINQGQSRALQLFHTAAEHVPAYKDFLTKNKLNHQLIKTITDFESIPATTKENYIDHYPFKSRCWQGKLNNLQIISTSSGTTGNPHSWPRTWVSELEGAYIHQLLFDNLFNIKKTSTLFINGFALGNWIAGTYTHACLQWLSLKRPLFTMATPGYNLDAVIDSLAHLSPDFQQTIIAGHVPFLKEVVETAIERGVSLPPSLKLFGTGQAITENWRQYMAELIGESIDSIVVVYGSADAGLMGFETRKTVALRRQFSINSDTLKQQFGENRLPSIYAFDPRTTFFSVENKELIITKDTGMPLIKYNIHDNGGLLDTGISHLPATTISRSPLDQFPLLYLFGREKFMVKFYGANIYSEHVQHALNQPQLQTILTGRFKIYMEYDQDQNPQLICQVELRRGIKPISAYRQKIQQVFVEEITKINSEYQFIFKEMGTKVLPAIILNKHGHPKHFPTDKIIKTA